MSPKADASDGHGSRQSRRDGISRNGGRFEFESGRACVDYGAYETYRTKIRSPGYRHGRRITFPPTGRTFRTRAYENLFPSLFIAPYSSRRNKSRFTRPFLPSYRAYIAISPQSRHHRHPGRIIVIIFFLRDVFIFLPRTIPPPLI